MSRFYPKNGILTPKNPNWKLNIQNIKDSDWIPIYGTFVRDSSSVFHFEGDGMDILVGCGICINGIIPTNFIYAKTAGQNMFSVYGTPLPTTITSILVNFGSRKAVYKADFGENNAGGLNTVSSSLFADANNNTRLFYFGQRAAIVAIHTYCYNIGTNPNGCKVNFNINSNPVGLLSSHLNVPTGLQHCGVTLQAPPLKNGDEIKIEVKTATGANDCKQGWAQFITYSY